MAATLALAIGVAGSTLAGPAAGSGGWSTSGLERLTSWWSSLWGGGPTTMWAGSEASPNLDPNGAAPNRDPDGAYPNLDPNGPSTQHVESDDDSDASPNLDPDG